MCSKLFFMPLVPFCALKRPYFSGVPPAEIPQTLIRTLCSGLTWALRRERACHETEGKASRKRFFHAGVVYGLQAVIPFCLPAAALSEDGDNVFHSGSSRESIPMRGSCLGEGSWQPVPMQIARCGLCCAAALSQRMHNPRKGQRE